MGRHILFMDQKTQCYEYVNSPQIDRRPNAIPIKITTAFFPKMEKLILKYGIVSGQRSQNKMENEEQS